MNLLNEAWIPVLRRSGRRQVICPAEFVDGLENDPVIRLDAVRADFIGSLLQFFIGLLQTALTPEDVEEWEQRLFEPPTVKELQAAFKPYESAFELDGDGPRFFQDLELPAQAESSIGSLLIDAPGENTLKKNADHFVKRDLVQQMCPACTATALLTLQMNAPSGGSGHRPSLRGGGPLTTIVFSETPGYDTLWHTVWLNILLKNELAQTRCNTTVKASETMFPWLQPTRVSDQDGTQVPGSEIHPVHVYWSMPRRIRLAAPVTEEGRCSLCNMQGNLFYRDYNRATHGPQYATGIMHPLSPYYYKDKDLLPHHPQPGGFTYRQWPAFTIASDPSGERAIVVKVLADRLSSIDASIEWRIHVFGYDMDNMKARCWYETRMPYWHIADEHGREHFGQLALRMADVAEMLAKNTVDAVKEAFLDRPPKGAQDALAYISSEFWHRSESDYYSTLNAMKGILNDEAAIESELREWLGRLQGLSLAIFDTYAEQIPLDSCHEDKVPRVIRAREGLRNKNFAKKTLEKLGIKAEAVGGKV